MNLQLFRPSFVTILTLFCLSSWSFPALALRMEVPLAPCQDSTPEPMQGVFCGGTVTVTFNPNPDSPPPPPTWGELKPTYRNNLDNIGGSSRPPRGSFSAPLNLCRSLPSISEKKKHLESKNKILESEREEKVKQLPNYDKSINELGELIEKMDSEILKKVTDEKRKLADVEEECFTRALWGLNGKPIRSQECLNARTAFARIHKERQDMQVSRDTHIPAYNQLRKDQRELMNQVDQINLQITNNKAKIEDYSDSISVLQEKCAKRK